MGGAPASAFVRLPSRKENKHRDAEVLRRFGWRGRRGASLGAEGASPFLQDVPVPASPAGQEHPKAYREVAFAGGRAFHLLFEDVASFRFLHSDVRVGDIQLEP